MSAAGDAVVAEARKWIGYAEGPNNSTVFWDWWGWNGGPWCACFASYVSWHGGYPACPIETEKGYVLVSNATYHAYTTGQEAKATAALEPGDHVLFSWEPWEFRNGVPTCVGEWDGWTAGDHVGIVSVPPDANGWFSAIEGNTSSLSYDNGGEVRERSDRHVSQVCGWYRPASYGASQLPGPGPAPPTYNLTGLGMYLLSNTRRGIWLMGPGYAKGLNPEEFIQVNGIPGIGTVDTGDDEHAFNLHYDACLRGVTAAEN